MTNETTTRALGPADIKAWRERLGLSTRWLAERWDVRELTVQRWERDRRAPEGVIADLRALIAEHQRQAEELAGSDVEQVQVPRVDPDSPDRGWPAAWYRSVGLSSGKPLVFLPASDEDGQQP